MNDMNDDEWLSVIMNHSEDERQLMTMNDSEWQLMIVNDKDR